jgi:NADPH:quinone reductase-like Zn-dependent oxidoreductase
MRAALCHGYGGPETVSPGDAPEPAIEGRALLVRVHATSVSAADSRIRGSRFPTGFGLIGRLVFGLSRPRRQVLGADFAGVVAAIGPDVRRFQVGDHVMGATGMRMGCHAEFVAVAEDAALTPVARGWSHADAAAVIFGGMTALHHLTAPGRLAHGERLLVNGASGAVGIAAVQIGKHLGAHVTAVCSTGNAERVRAVGADAVMDYGQTDFAAAGETWDVILDAVGNAPLSRVRTALRPGGRLLMMAASLPELLVSPLSARLGGLNAAGGPAPETRELLERLKAMCEADALKPLIDSTYPLERIADAHARVDTGRKVGSVIVTP